MRNRTVPRWVAVVWCVAGPFRGIAQTVDFAGLLRTLLDRDALACNPGTQWTLHHASSYDRHSVTKDSAGWFANQDWDQYIRTEVHDGHTEYVLIDADGPGVITRFWAAGHARQEGHLRFYMDGATEPFWVTDHWGDLIGQNRDIGQPLSQRSVELDTLSINPGAQAGQNLYAPIPFRHHIKVTYDVTPAGWQTGLWYNIDYRVYRPGTDVESFSASTSARFAEALRRANDSLAAFMVAPPDKPAPGEIRLRTLSFALSPGASTELDLKGPGSIRRLLVTLRGADAQGPAFGSLGVRIAFDGRETVDAPAGFLFGCGDQSVSSGTWYCKSNGHGIGAAYWIMPFRREARVRLVNEGKKMISGTVLLAAGLWRWDARSMYFHAAYHEWKDVSVPPGKSGLDLPFLDLPAGAGVYVGDILEVRKTVGGWWGEGDEKIYVDGGTFPMDFGTGSEDYYGYAWGHPETFNHIFNAQPAGDANLEKKGGITVDLRDRDLDAIPFHKGFHFDMESLWKGAPIELDWAGFWYTR